MKPYQEREIFAYGRYIQCQILNWNEGPPPPYLICNPLDGEHTEEFIARQGMGTWMRVDLREIVEGFEQHQRGHENSIRAIGRLLRLCDDNGLGDKAREAMKGMEMTDAETIAVVRGALNTEETGENLVEVARAAHAAELRMAYLISDADVEALARAMCEDDGFKWDAKDFGETANGEEPAEQREYWRHKARMAADHFPNVGERNA